MSAGVSRYKLEVYVIQMGGAYITAYQEEGMLLQKYRDRKGRCIAMLFKSIGVRGRCDSCDLNHRPNHRECLQ